MEKELCGICTGSYTGEFSPKWRGPWAKYFDAAGFFISATAQAKNVQLSERETRLRDLREQGRVPLSDVYSRY